MTKLRDLSRLPNFKDALEEARATMESREVAFPSNLESAIEAPSSPSLEAVIQSKLRPAFYISRDLIIHDPENAEGIFVSNESFEGKGELLDLQTKLEKSAHQVGHVRLFGGFMNFAGTGWLVEDDLMVTNRHVANLFVRISTFDQPEIPRSVRVELDSLDQIQTQPSHISRETFATVMEPIFIADRHGPDVALFKVNRSFVEPIRISESNPKDEDFIGVVGYPAEDIRDNDRDLIRTFFGPEFDLKRFSPGRVMSINNGLLLHDASTLGGSSGSALFSFEEEPKIVGLHFGGLPNESNAAVPASVLNAIIRDRRERGVFGGATIGDGGVPTETPTADPDRFEGRKGFDRTFLGDGAEVDIARILAPVEGNLAELKEGGKELKYHHFSVFMNETRRVAALTAVNINGNRLASRPGSFTWKFDGRMEVEFQAGDPIYLHNPIDKGHLVRRLDPVWIPEGFSGDVDVHMREIIEDTYHYTVAGPQHSRLNRREWLELEDYILDASGNFDFKISVLTGPIFASDDPILKSRSTAGESDSIPVPLEFWKVAVMRDLNTGEMRSAGFMLSQGDFLHDMNEAAFVLGESGVFRAPLKTIAENTGLDFSALFDAEVPPPADPSESVLPDSSIYRITGPEDVFF